MKKLRLLLLVMMLVGSYSTFNASNGNCNGVEVEGEGGGTCPREERPIGCACCSDNHCASRKCSSSSDKCVAAVNPY